MPSTFASSVPTPHRAVPVSETARRRGGRAWLGPALIAGFLLLSVGANMALLAFATHDASFAVVPDYYQRALHFDEHLATLRASTALGWHVDVRLAAGNSPRLRVEVRDRDGRAVTGLGGTVHYFHRARAADVHTAQLTAVGPGEYETPFDGTKSGLWVVQLDLRKPAAHYVGTHSLELVR